jgi:serine protease AprX
MRSVSRGPAAARWFLAASIVAALGCGAPSFVRAETPFDRLDKIDSRLMTLLAAPGDSAAVWVEFVDKGDDGPAGMAALLARAEASLTPRALARRRRARVVPLVHERDVPVAPRYLEALEARGLAPIAVSRWFNRAAVRVPAHRLVELAGFDFVRRVTPVERATRIRDIETGANESVLGRPSPARPPEAERSASEVDYGMTFDQLDQLGLPDVHACGYTGRGVLVCVLDEGFNQHDRHEALRDRLIAPGHRRDFVEGDTVVTDTASAVSRHGTWVLGCLAADRFGTYVGAAYGADLALARTEDGTREVPAEMLYWGMGAEWADSLGADVISSSVGYFEFNDPFPDYTYADMNGHTTDVTRAAQIAASKGILVVNAVGNEGNTPWRHLIAPADANGDSMLAIGAVDLFGDTTSFSSAGPSADGRTKPDVVARGLSNPIVSTSGNPSAYSTNSGTSFAAPLVAGLMACLIEARPDLTPVDLITAVRATASRAGAPDQKMGYGIPNALAALHRTIDPGATPSGFFRVALEGANPIRAGSVRVSFNVADGDAEPLEARLRVIDLQGRALRTLWSGRLCYGQMGLAEWDGTREDGSRAGPGVYWLALEGAGHLERVRVVALR